MQHTALKNYMEDMVCEKLDEILRKYPDICSCERCRMDVAAYALNQLPPKYVVTRKGHMYARIQEMIQQCEATLVVAITKGIDIVRANPRH
jgi:competence protein ComFB